tara:strand:+ start:4229 stop:4399 length:171 start_codon:yes stop_codon:yes gene_type:complete
LPQLFADELAFLIAKFRIVYRMPTLAIVGVLVELIGELLKPDREQDDDDFLPPNRN